MNAPNVHASQLCWQPSGSDGIPKSREVTANSPSGARRLNDYFLMIQS